MKVIAFNGSPKKKGNTYHALKLVLDEIEKEGIETEIIDVGAMNVKACLGCGACAKAKNETCVAIKDELNDVIQKVKNADGLLLGSPVYYAAVSGNIKSFLDRFFMVCGVNNSMLRHKVGASIVAVRRSGGLPAFNELNQYINYSEMIMPTSNYWNVIHGHTPSEVLKDAEGVQIMQVLGKNMAWLLKVIDKTDVKKPVIDKKVWTNFVRE